MVVIVFGLPGSGKSYFASRLATVINAEYISSDRVRMKMFAERTYSSRERMAVYNEMLAQAKRCISKQKNVVLDATFYSNGTREKFRNEMETLAPVFFIEITADEVLVMERLRQKRAESEAGALVYEKIKAQWEPLAEKHLVLESLSDNIGNMLEKAAGYLHAENDKRTNKPTGA